MTYIVLLIVAVLSIAFFWFQSPGKFTGISDYVKQTTGSMIASDSAIMKPVSLSRDIARSADINAIQNALLQYRIEKGLYPDTLEMLFPDYIGEIPTDPQTHVPYKYSMEMKGENYKICVIFETKTNQENPCYFSN